ncbi:MAG TPA: NAD(P)-dependent oxidoreductase [Burkholderiales bacterium]|nr:NAD(P)-dependent oxidoreductase [Burkholderiales bacterium]
MKLAFIGLGAMGRHMATNVQKAGHEVRAYDLRPVEGFKLFPSVAEAAKGCELVFTSVPGPDDVDKVGAELKGVLQRGAAWFDLSTNSPTRVRRLHKEMQEKGIHLLDAPVSGGTTGAQSGKLAIWIGGEKAMYDKYLPVVRTIGDQPFYVGDIGSATVAKLAHNIASFTIHAAMAEIFSLGVKGGVEPLALFRAIRQGATGRKRTFDRLAEYYLPGNFDPASFSLKLAHKDAVLALELAKEVGVPMQFSQIALDELERGIERGWTDRDFRVAMTLQEERARVKVRVSKEELKKALDE